MPTREERIVGGMYGLLIGDALGVPYEFHLPEQIPPREQIEFESPAGFHRAHSGVPPGTWSDDGAHALCLLASLLYQKTLDPEDLGRRLWNWYELGYMAVDSEVFDVGVQTSEALSTFRAGTSALQSGPRDERKNGNGSLMRVLPLALWHTGPDEALVRDAMTQSLITHGHLRSQLCCALYCLWARRTLQGAADPWKEALATLRQLYPEGHEAHAELQFHIRPDRPEPGHGSGYVVDCLISARDCVRAEATYEGVVKAAVALGNDTDTTAAVAGGIAGLRDGIEAIPERWRSALRGKELVEPMIRELIQRI